MRGACARIGPVTLVLFVAMAGSAVASGFGGVRVVTAERADSDCIGDLDTPVCAVETHVACLAGFGGRWCEAPDNTVGVQYEILSVHRSCFEDVIDFVCQDPYAAGLFKPRLDKSFPGMAAIRSVLRRVCAAERTAIPPNLKREFLEVWAWRELARSIDVGNYDITLAFAFCASVDACDSQRLLRDDLALSASAAPREEGWRIVDWHAFDPTVHCEKGCYQDLPGFCLC